MSGAYDCDKESLGQPSFDSCMDAYAQMPDDSHARSYGDRETQLIYEFPLPLRYASGECDPLTEVEISLTPANDLRVDETCIIEVFPTVAGLSDLIQPLYLKQSVRYLIQKCIDVQNPEQWMAN